MPPPIQMAAVLTELSSPSLCFGLGIARKFGQLPLLQQPPLLFPPVLLTGEHVSNNGKVDFQVPNVLSC